MSDLTLKKCCDILISWRRRIVSEENLLAPQHNDLQSIGLSIAAAAAQRKFLTQLVTLEELDRIQPGYFNILAAPRGRGKTTLAFDDEILLKFSRAYKHIIYLIHTRANRDGIVAAHPDKAAAFTDAEVNGWFTKRHKRMWSVEEDSEKVQVMCYQTFAALLRKDIDWLDDIDLIIWDEFDDVEQYYWNDIKRAKKEFPDLDSERLASLLQEGKHTSIPAFIYNIQTHILEPGRIRLLAVSATPESAAVLFSGYVNYILNGRLDEIFDAKNTVYVENVAKYIASDIVTPQTNICPWIFTPHINDILRLAELCKSKGFKVLTVWSFDNNSDWRAYVTEEMRNAELYMRDTHMVPAQYDCVITNQAFGRGFDIIDERFQDWFCDSKYYSDIGQFIRARYRPNNQYLLTETKGLIEFVRAEGHFPAEYYIWHTKDEINQLLLEKPIYSKDYTMQLKTWNQVVKQWGDELIFESGAKGKARRMQYRIAGVKEPEKVTE